MNKELQARTEDNSSITAELLPSANIAQNPMLPAVVSGKLRPILFSTPMVEAILDGRKTQTRRLTKIGNDYKYLGHSKNENDIEIFDFCSPTSKFGFATDFIKSKYNVGDILWVRETFAETCDEYGSPIIAYKAGKPRLITGCNGKYELWKETDTNWSIDNFPACGKWKPSLFMPFFACRLFLKITKVKVQRLQEISKEDAICEGVESTQLNDVTFYKDYEYNRWLHINPKSSFATLWYKINGIKSWDENPLVWVVEFEVCPKP